MSLVGTPIPLNFLCGNAVSRRSRPTTPATGHDHERPQGGGARGALPPPPLENLTRKNSRGGPYNKRRN